MKKCSWHCQFTLERMTVMDFIKIRLMLTFISGGERCDLTCFRKIIMGKVWNCIRGDRLEAGNPVGALGYLLDE